MTAKVPYETVQYQSHHHCQCDFCNSRRTVNAKKFGVSESIAALKSAQHRSNCCCPCHEVLAARSYGANNAAPSFELDDPEHHVNQTALNASNGRTGVPGGDVYTIAMDSAHGKSASGGRGANGSLGASKKSQEELEKDALEDLDRLERLLILEHKARVKATIDTENAQTALETGKGPRPIPFDATATATVPRGTVDAVPPPPPPGQTCCMGAMNSTAKTGPNVTLTKSGRKNFVGPRPEGAGVVWRRMYPGIPEDASGASGALGNTDKRDLWKSTVVGGSTLKKSTAPAQQTKMSPGACAAMKQQEEDGPLPTVCNPEEM